MRFPWADRRQHHSASRNIHHQLRWDELEDRTVPAGGDYGLTLHLKSTDGVEGQRIVARDGFVYVTGYFDGPLNVDSIDISMNLHSLGTSVFVAKYTDRGSLVWAKSFQSENYVVGYGLAVDDLGNVYTTGGFVGTVDFDPSPTGVASLTTETVQKSFVCKLDPEGNYLWATSVVSPWNNIGWMVALDDDRNVYTVGQFGGTADFNPDPHPILGLANFTSQGGDDIYVRKLNPDGQYLWAKTLGGTGTDIGYGIAVDNAGIYVTGQFTGTADFNPDPHPTLGLANLVSNGNADIFVSKLDRDGNYQWAQNMGGTGRDVGWGLALDHHGNIHLAGEFQGTADFDPNSEIGNLASHGASDIVVGQWDNHGDYRWAKNLGGSGDDRAFDLALDVDGNVYTTGNFRSTADFDPSIEIANLTSHGQDDIFVSKLDANGQYVWAKHVGGSANDLGFGVAVDPSGNVYHTGYFQGTADFDPGIGYNNRISDGSSDAFVNQLLGDDVGLGGELVFGQPEYHGAEGTTITVTVERLSGTGNVSVNYMTLGDGLATAGIDYTPTSGTLTWADGDTAAKTFTITTLDDDQYEGRENILVVLYGATGNAMIGMPSSANVFINHSDGQPLGSFTDSDGDLGKITLTGGGTGVFYLDDPDGDGRGDIDRIELTGTNSRTSVLTIAVTKPPTVTGPDAGVISVGMVTAPALKHLNAPRVNVTGVGIDIAGHLGLLTVGDVLNGADIRTGPGTTTQTTTINTQRVGHGTTINIGTRLASLSAVDVGVGAIIAPSIGKITTRGRTAVAGDFGATVTVSGAGLATNAIALNSLSVAGSLLSDVTLTAPSIHSVSVRGHMAGQVNVSGQGLTPNRIALRSLNVLGRLTADIDVDGIITTISSLEFPSGSVQANRLGTLRTLGRKATSTLSAVAGDLGAPITLSDAVGLGTLSVAGRMLVTASLATPRVTTLFVKSDLLANITASGAGLPPTQPVIGNFNVGGRIMGSAINANGPITSLTTAAFPSGSLSASRLTTLNITGSKALNIVGDWGAAMTLTGVGLAPNNPAWLKGTIAGSVLATTTITAPSIGTLTVRGNFLGDMSLSGTGMAATRHTLGRLSVLGTVTASNLFVTGNIGTVTVGRMINSRLFAGFMGADDGNGTFSGIGTMTSFTSTAIADSFEQSHVIGEKIGAITLKSINTNNGGNTFGVISNTTIGTVRSSAPVFVYSPTHTTVHDFSVRVV